MRMVTVTRGGGQPTKQKWEDEKSKYHLEKWSTKMRFDPDGDWTKRRRIGSKASNASTVQGYRKMPTQRSGRKIEGRS